MTLGDAGVVGGCILIAQGALKVAEYAVRKKRNGHNGKNSGELPKSEWELTIGNIVQTKLDSKIDPLADDISTVKQVTLTFVESRGKDMSRLFDELRELRNRGKAK